MSDININNDIIDLGSDPAIEEFDPFIDDDESAEVRTNEATKEQAKPAPVETKKLETKEAEQPGFADKLPIFEYAGVSENINDVSKTFDELRIEKSSDFPELEDGKRVSWTVEYGKISRAVADPKGTSIGKIKSDIETSKEFEDSLRKRGADKNPTCKVKPRVTAQSKGQASAYRGVFTNLDEANSAGKAISIVPARDGSVYEIRDTAMGRFITPTDGCELLSEIRAGFIPALQRIPMELMLKVVSFFRSYMNDECEQEVLVNIYWDKVYLAFVADAPEQTVSKSSVHSHENPEYVNEQYIHYMDIHSHNSMNAFFSAVDDKDEKATRLYTVIGHLNEYFPDISMRISNGGKFWNIDPCEVFEHITSPIPDEWKARVHFKEGEHEVFAGSTR